MFGHVITIRVSAVRLQAQQTLLDTRLQLDQVIGQRTALEATLQQAQEALHQQTADAEPAEQPSPSRTEAMVGRITTTAAVSKPGAYASCLMKLGCRGGPHHLLVSCPRCAKLKLRQCPPLTAFLHWCCRRVVCSVMLPALLRAAHPKYFSLQ